MLDRELINKELGSRCQVLGYRLTENQNLTPRTYRLKPRRSVRIRMEERGEAAVG